MGTANILVCGAGQLGSRYLQGLAKCPTPLDIRVHDVRADSLRAAERRWNEARDPECPHRLSLDSSLEALPHTLDIAIVATTADVRPQAAGAIAEHCAVRFWIFEKVLAQSERGLDQLRSHVQDASRAWVNTPRRIMPWHRRIRAELAGTGPMRLEVTGGQWGLACNAVHYLDLLAWWAGETIERVSAQRLDPVWFESKRPGFMEVSGTLEAWYSGGSRALLTAVSVAGPVSITVSNARDRWELDETQGIARRSDGFEIRGRLDYQSDMTADLVASMLAQGACGLPGLEESIAIHRPFITALREHWSRAGNAAAASVPIT